MTDVVIDYAQQLAVTADLDAAPDDGEKRTVTGVAVPFGVPSAPDSISGKRWIFDGPPTNPDEMVDAVYGHNPNRVVGRLSAWQAAADKLGAAVRMFTTTAGNDALTEAREGVLTGFSIGASIDDYREDAGGLRRVKQWTVRHIGLVRRPAFATNSLSIAAAQATPDTTEEGTAHMGNQDQQSAGDVVELPTVAELAQQIAPAVAEMLDEKKDRHPLAQFETFADYCEAIYDADDDERTRLHAAFAAADQLSPENPGVIPPGWRSEIKANLDRRQPAVNHFGSIGLPESGMQANWPYLDPALNVDTIIKQQTSEKSQLSGVKVKILKGTQDIKTAGAVSDISYQLLRRSSPAYLQAYMRVLFAAWARYVEAKFEAALATASAGAGAYLGEAAGTTAAAIRGQLFAASAMVEDATGAPADVTLVAPDVFTAWGKLDGLHNPKYGTQNAAGTASARTLTIDVNGLPVRRAPFLEPGKVLVSNAEAAKAPSSGPLVATEEDVVKLGRDVAVWGMYEDAETYYPSGVVTVAAPPA